MKTILLLCAGALALAGSAPALHAQTDLGQRYAQIGVASYKPIEAIDSGTGFTGKFNLPTMKNLDLYLRGAIATADENGLSWTDSRIVGGMTIHWQMESFRPFVSLEAGYETFDSTLSVGEMDYDYSDESAIYTGALGVQFSLGDTFTVAPMAVYEIYYEIPGGDWSVGAEVNAKLGDHFNVLATLLASSSSDSTLSLAARFRF